MKPNGDIRILRELAKQYAAIAAKPVQDERRRLWTDHLSLRKTRPPVLTNYGMWNVWCREVFGDAAMKCQDPFYRTHERTLRMEIFHDGIGDDYIQEPWLTVCGSQKLGWNDIWGVRLGHTGPGVEGGAWKFDPELKTWADVGKLVPPVHQIDEAATAANVQRLSDAVGDIVTINVDRGPACQGFCADLSTHLCQLRGLEQVMIDMYESPGELHRVLAFMRDGILANQAAAEAAGDYGLTSQQNQCMTYCDELPKPKANVRPVSPGRLWVFSAAQEFTLISPAMHDEFMLQYQKPIIERGGLSAYGCCEDLTRKIDMLPQVKNLRVIAVTPRADVARCTEQIGSEYVLSWRPNPADMVCCGFDEGKIRRILGEGLRASRGCYTHIHLKDIETVEGDVERLGRWTRIAREEIDKC